MPLNEQLETDIGRFFVNEDTEIILYGYSNAEMLTEKIKKRLFLKKVLQITPQGNAQAWQNR